MTRQPIAFVADEARNVWRKSRSGGLVERVLRLLGAASKVEVIYIAEYANGDWDTGNFTGDPASVWAYRGDEFEELEALGKLDPSSAIASRTPVIHYCLASDGKRMIHVRRNGLRSALGHILRWTDGKWKSEGRRWIS